MSKLQDFLNSSVSDVTPMARRTKTGDLFGIELECEGYAVDWDGGDDIVRQWEPHRDGSLRNNHGDACEWVFKGPVTYEKSIERVNLLFDYFKRRGSRLVCSNRTSTHVHFNMGDKQAYQVVNMFILFTILEDLLDRYCGEDRRGNLFCLSSRHAEEQVRWVENACFKSGAFNFADNNRYCAFNLAALNKFGSVEFRSMRGLDNREDMLAWLEILKEFTNYACYMMKNPVNLIEEISMVTPLGFIKKVFSPKNAMKLTHGIDEYVIDASIYEGLRLVQMLCYRVGTEFDQVKMKGKDFWASFQKDAPNEEEYQEPAPVRGRQRAAPFFRAIMPQPDNLQNPAAEMLLGNWEDDIAPAAQPKPLAPGMQQRIRRAQEREARLAAEFLGREQRDERIDPNAPF